MQIHKSKYQKNKNSQLWWILGALLVCVVLYAFLSSSKGGGGVFCDMESLTDDKSKFITKGKYFSNGQTQSDHKARSGKYSSKLDSKQIYGPTYVFEHVYSGDVYEASVWMNNDNGFGNLSFSGSWGFYSDQKKSSKTEDGWHLLKHRDTVPPGVYDETLNVYPNTNREGKAVYFDDMYVRRVSKGNPAAIPVLSDDPNKKLDFIVDGKNLDKLKQKRIGAYKRGNLISSKDDLVPAKIKVGGTEVDADIRLKGDLLDHLNGRKWSFRIHAKDGSAWNGMKVFSVHNSKSRDHLSEWVFHKMLEDEDVLTTKYDFIEVALNGESLGVYAYEEHFLKQLLQWQNRTEGPILKISEDAHWEYAGRKFGKHLAYYESAQIEPFDKDAMKKSNAYAAAFEKGQNLLNGFMHGNLSVSEVFNVDRLAKYLAIQDVCNAWHSFNYTNLRFYFNAQSGKLEPIGFDGFTSDGLKYNKDLYITGSQVNSLTNEQVTPHKFVYQFHKKIFTNLEFAELYNQNLDRLSSAGYLDAFKNKHETALRERVLFVQKGYTDYRFDWNTFFDNAKDIQEVIAPASEISLKAFREGKEVLLRSYHLLPLEVLGFGGDKMTIKTNSRILLESYDKTKSVLEKRITLPSGVKRIFVRTLGTERVVSFPIFRWSAPNEVNAAALKLKENANQFSMLVDSPEAYIIPKGNHTLSKSLVVKSKPLFIQAGANIDLKNGASIIVLHSVQALANKDNPIVIGSSNRTGQGLVLSNTKEESDFKSCTFDNLQSSKQGSIYTSGGLNISESKVKFERCVFSQSKAKDALSFNRSEYELNDCVILDASGDGIDANFSTGIIENLTVQNVGKDAVEISGGYCRMSSSKISNTSSAAFNVNQHGTAELMAVEIQDCAEGIKSVDLSDVTLSSSKLKNVNTGVLAFRKNDEMGGGTIRIFGLTQENVTKRNVQDQHSEIYLDRQKLAGQ